MKYCKYCGNPLREGATFCRSCGRNTEIPEYTPPAAAQHPAQTAPAAYSAPDRSPKNRWVALVLLLFLGAFGAHKFYAGRKGGGAVLLLLTLSGFALLIFIEFVLSSLLLLVCLVILVSDFFQILTGHFRDGTGLKMK